MNDEPKKSFSANHLVAEALGEAASLLAQQNAGRFRVLAYRRAATVVEGLDRDIAEIAARGIDELEALPHIGRSIAAAIFELIATGRWSQLERLRGSLDPELAFRSVPGIGPAFAKLIHEHLHVDTLEALEAAAHDGRLAKVPGIGHRRIAIIRNALASILERRRFRLDRSSHQPPPDVSLLLDVDEEYRAKAKTGELRLIAPRRFNPQGRSWLPILHTERPPWHFTVMFSNTARAHELGKTGDWVVLFYATDHSSEDQCTIVTETTGALKGKRVVRGREKECAVHWSKVAQTKESTGAPSSPALLG